MFSLLVVRIILGGNGHWMTLDKISLNEFDLSKNLCKKPLRSSHQNLNWFGRNGYLGTLFKNTLYWSKHRQIWPIKNMTTACACVCVCGGGGGLSR